MDFFFTYFQLGFEHIFEWEAMDHILFIISFTCIYTFAKTKEAILLATAFTIGHTITLALSSLNFIQVNIDWVEFFIPLTIFFTALTNLGFDQKKINEQKFNIEKYLMIGVFGLIHGLGFSSYLKSLLGQESSIVLPLLSFNIGLEIAQIILIVLTLFITSILIQFLRVKSKMLVIVSSSIIMGYIIHMLIERFP